MNLSQKAPAKPAKFSWDALLKTSLLVFAFLVITKLFNFYKKILISKLFGVTWVADAFFAASFLPYYLAIFFEGVIYLGFLPHFSRLKEENEETAKRFAGEAFFLLLSVTLSLALAGWFTAPWLVRQMVPGFSPAEMSLTCQLFRILIGVVVFISLGFFFQSLNSYFNHHIFAVSSGIVDTVVMILVTLVSWKIWGIHGAALGAVCGALAVFIFQAVSLNLRHKILPKRLLPLKTMRNGKLFTFLVSISFIWIFQQVPLVILNRFGSGMWEGTISALTISQTLTTVPMALVSQTVLLTIFPSLTKQAVSLTGESPQNTFYHTLQASFFVLIPTGFLLSAMSRPVAALFFSGSGASVEGVRRIANALSCFGWATFALYADLFMRQSLMAVQKAKPAIFLSLVRAILTYLFSYFLSSWWDYQGLALSFSLALAANFFIFFPFFFRRTSLNMEWKKLFGYVFRLLFAASPILALAGLLNLWSVGQWMKFPSSLKVTAMLAGTLSGMSGYFLLLYLLKVQQLHSVFESLKRLWAQKNWFLADTSN